MEEKFTNQENQFTETFVSEPENLDNSETNISETLPEMPEKTQKNRESELKDPQKNKLLGKFKSVEDLSKAYEELQKHQGKSSEELGSLRKELAKFEEFKNATQFVQNYHDSILPVIKRDRETYPEYFENKTFNEMYSEALMVYGDNLDTDRMVNMLESYVKTRIEAYDKQKSASGETQQVLNSMTYSKNPKDSLTPPKKTLDEMSEDEFKASLRKLI